VEIRPEWGQVFLRLEKIEDLERVPADVALRRVEVQRPEHAEEILEKVGEGVRVITRVRLGDVGELDPELPKRWEPRSVCLWATVADDDPGSMVECAKKASLQGWPVLLPPEPAVARSPNELMLDILDHYLFTKELSVPIEPLHSMLVAKVQRNGRTLWNMWYGKPAYHFYVASSGRVGMHPGWAERDDLTYGTSSGTVAEWRATAGYQRATERAVRRTPLDPRCKECGHFSLCGGALLAIDPKAGCAVWTEVFERIRLAAGFIMEQRGGTGRRSSKDRRGRDRRKRRKRSDG
jgi:hypothetical protein